MIKNFNKWNEVKKQLDIKESNILINEREIWVCHLGLNIGIEQNGDSENFCRPVLIFKKYSSNHILCLPLTSKGNNSRYHFPLFNYDFLKLRSFVILSQIRTIDSNRLKRKLGKISVDTFQQIKKSAQDVLDLKPRVPNGNSDI